MWKWGITNGGFLPFSLMAQQGCRAGAGSCPCPRKLLCVFSNCTMMCRGDCEARGNLCLSLQMPWHFLVPSLTASCSWQPHAPFAAGVTFLLGCSVLGRGLLPHNVPIAWWVPSPSQALPVRASASSSPKDHGSLTLCSVCVSQGPYVASGPSGKGVLSPSHCLSLSSLLSVPAQPPWCMCPQE